MFLEVDFRHDLHNGTFNPVLQCHVTEVSWREASGLRQMELRRFCQQDSCDLEVGEHHIRGSMGGLVVGALESVALNRRVGQGAYLGHKVFDVFLGDVKRVVVQELIDP